MTNTPHLNSAQLHHAPVCTRHALLARLQELAIARRQETAAAFAKAPGRELDVDRLMLVDAGVIACNPALDALRAELGLPTPVVPSAREHSDLSRRLYKGRDLDTAFAPAVGG